MRRHAKASTAGSTKRQAGGLGRAFRRAVTRGASHRFNGSGARSDVPTAANVAGRRSSLAIAALALAALLLFAAPAFAGTATDRPLLFSFDGSGTDAGAFSNVRALEIDQSSGTVYVIDQGHNVLDKLSAAGAAQDFSATGSSSLASGFNFSEFSDVAVDNSATNPGRIQVVQGSGPVKAFSPAGASLWEFSDLGFACGIAVDTAGHPWISDSSRVHEYASTGSPPAEISLLETAPDQPCRLDVDASGNVYANRYLEGVDKFEGGVLGPTIDSAPSNGVTVDQSSATGHVFTLHGEDFNEYESSGTLVGTFGSGAIGNGQGIAYDKALDRVYVSDGSSNTVKVFGPLVSGTVPDPTIEASEVGVSKAKFHGKINPQSVPNSYFFEWKEGEGESWFGAQTSAPQSLPEDSSEHAVSFNATGLRGNTTYQVRLVGVNTENHLRAVSSADTFATATATAAPAVTIAAPSSVTTTTAKVTGTVDPQEDFGTTWHTEISTDPACSSEFSEGPTENLESEVTSPVSEDLTGLLPSQHYCVRISATNSFGPAASETKEFTTQAIAPDQVFTAFAAPRTDTTARINARVNPEGAPLTYHFEYSEDGGATWIPLANRQNTSGARVQIVVADELTNLQPNTTYSYRFFAENSGGPASPQGDAKTFTTRTSAETVLPARGIELVNSPDKGVQNATPPLLGSGQPPLSADGNSFVWTVTGGAPGGTSGASNAFLAGRGADGWHSRSLLPPAPVQVGGGSRQYLPASISADFSHFLFATLNGSGAPLQALPGSTYARLDAEQNQELLATVEAERGNFARLDFDATDDLEHVLIVNSDTHLLEDIGDGSPEVVGLMSDGLPPACGIPIGEGFKGVGNALAGHAQNYPGYHWLATTDASRVFFESAGNTCNGRLNLYVRNRETDTTTEIAPAITSSVEFIRATPDGRSAFLVSRDELNGEDTNSNGDVYRWDEGSGLTCLTCVVPDAGITTYNGGSLHTLVSDDSSHLYFESPRQLIPGEGVDGEYNLYVVSGGELRYVATPHDRENDLLDENSARISSDGNVLVFRSSENLLTEDAITAECLSTGGGHDHPCNELYRYDDRDGSLECVSCRRGGLTTGGTDSNFALSADGETIAFVSGGPLLAEDINGAPDGYEWYRGSLRLISDGESKYPQWGAGSASAVKVLGVDADGSDIFFSVAAPTPVTGYEHDGLVNIYDARVGGGFPRPTSPAPCSGDSCQGPLQAAPEGATTASAGFSGHGNVAPQVHKRRPCAHKRGQARRHCVRKHKRQARIANAHDNTGRAK